MIELGEQGTLGSVQAHCLILQQGVVWSLLSKFLDLVLRVLRQGTGLPVQTCCPVRRRVRQAEEALRTADPFCMAVGARDRSLVCRSRIVLTMARWSQGPGISWIAEHRTSLVVPVVLAGRSLLLLLGGGCSVALGLRSSSLGHGYPARRS